MPPAEGMDTEMADELSMPEGQAAYPPRVSGIANGLQSAELTPSLVNSAYASREPSLPTKGVSQLVLATPSDDEDDVDDDDDDLVRLSPQRPALPISTLPTGLCYDPRMRFHTELDPPKDRSDFHPEDPRRILWIYRTLCEAGLVDDPHLSLRPLVPQPLRMIPVRHATRAEVLKVHFEDHFEFLKHTASKLPLGRPWSPNTDIFGQPNLTKI